MWEEDRGRRGRLDDALVESEVDFLHLSYIRYINQMYLRTERFPCRERSEVDFLRLSYIRYINKTNNKNTFIQGLLRHGA